MTHGTHGMRMAHYVASTHWDREWYEPFQGYRMRLVSLLDEVLATIERDPEFKSFMMDGQTVPLYDYLEVRPEKRATVQRLLREGRLQSGPWYVLPDEWLVCGESMVRNLQMGMALTRELEGEPLRAGFVCDEFGHTGQLPQIFAQFTIGGAFIWRGTHESEHHGNFIWKAPDGSAVPTYRFGPGGYCTYAFCVRDPLTPEKQFSLDELVENLITYARQEAERSDAGPILLFDGGDHLEIEPRTSQIIAEANKHLATYGIQIIHSTLDLYLQDLQQSRDRIKLATTGELRESGRPAMAEDQQWVIPGVLSSRIHLKQRNAACEDELCLWAEPFSAFARSIGHEYPSGYLNVAWKHLLDNHAHDSICGCSIDQVHQDMIYRFDQSLGISARLTNRALTSIARAVTLERQPDGALALAVFNATAEAIDEPVDLEIPLPADWPKTFQEFFGYEQKFAFKLRGAGGEDIPYQLTGQQINRKGFSRERYKFPHDEVWHIAGVTAHLKVPPYGYTTLVVEPADGPTRYLGSMAKSHRVIENDFLRVQANSNGTIDITDKRSGHTFEQLLTFEQRADIGDGWYHGIAVNDQIYTSLASNADVALVTDGIAKATLRIALTMNVPDSFDFHTMTRSEHKTPLRIVSDVTLRNGAEQVEIVTTVDNTVLDHRLRVLFPTGLKGDSYISDAAFDVVERKIALAEDNAMRRELEVETRPQVTWTAFGDGQHGLAIVSRGLPESTVRDSEDRAIALTLLRAFRRAVMSNDNPGGQIQGKHTFRYQIVPFAAATPLKQLFLLGQRVNSPLRVVDLPADGSGLSQNPSLPLQHSFLQIDGDVVVTSVQAAGDGIQLRMFNPHPDGIQARITTPAAIHAARSVTLEGNDDSSSNVHASDGSAEVMVPAKRIATIMIE